MGTLVQHPDWNRLYHYPYVYYPQNFWSSEYYKSSNDLYHRYPPEMRVPVYNKQWHNMYPEGALYHSRAPLHPGYVLARSGPPQRAFPQAESSGPLAA